MTARERTYARVNNQRAAQYAELWIIARPQEIEAMVQAASGRLVYLSPPTPMGGDDTRFRRYLRLRTNRNGRQDRTTPGSNYRSCRPPINSPTERTSCRRCSRRRRATWTRP
jgi:hypothetical protein